MVGRHWSLALCIIGLLGQPIDVAAQSGPSLPRACRQLLPTQETITLS